MAMNSSAIVAAATNATSLIMTATSATSAAAAAVATTIGSHLIETMTRSSSGSGEGPTTSSSADGNGAERTTAGHLFATALALAATTKASTTFDDVRPVTLSAEWSRLARLILIACLAVVGSIGNVFMISSVMIEDHLKKAGNAFIVNVALADLLVTSILMPASTIVLLAGIDEPLLSVCRVQWFFAACAFLITVLSLALSTMENYLRLCTPQDIPSFFNKRKVTVLMLATWFVCSLASGLQFAFQTNFDYCTRTMTNVQSYQMTIVAVLILLPLVLTFYGHIRIIVDVKRFMRTPNFKPSLNYTWDLSLARTNFYSFIIFIVFWLPFGIVLAYHTTANVPNRVFYNTAWIGLSKSCFHNVIYCITNRHFRNAYVNLFHYCCCKTTVSVSRRQRNEVCRPSSDVRVHIIPGYNMYSYTSPQRSGNCHGYWNKRDTHDL